MRFDWRSEQEDEWQTEVPAATARTRHFRFLLSLAMLALVVAVALFRFGELRAEAVQESTREEVVAASDLLRDAAAQGDRELLDSLWGGGHAERADRQLMFDPGLLFDRQIVGLERRASAAIRRQVTLAPDLQRALVTVTLPYSGFVPGAGLQAVSLQHSMRYEKRDGRWLWIPYGDEYWGPRVTEERDDLQVIFHERDAVLATQLADDIGQPLRVICENLGTCSSPEIATLHFVPERARLLSPLAEVSAGTGRLTITVPTPTLMGRPEQERDYEALRGSYMWLLVRAFLAKEPRREELNSGLFRTGVYQRLLWELGLLPWPPQASPPSQATEEGGVNEDIWTLCVAGSRETNTLYRYRSASDLWESILQSDELTAVAFPDALEGFLLQRQPAASSGSRPQIVYWRGTQQIAVLPDLWLGAASENRPVVRAYDLQHHPLALWFGDGSKCTGKGCDVLQIPGNSATWSAGGDYALVRRQPEGSRSPPASDDMLFLTDGSGNPLIPLEHGYSAFWLDDTTFGYVRTPLESFTGGGDYAVMLGAVDGPRPRLLISAGELSDLLPDDARGRRFRFFIGDVFFHPTYPQRLFLLASSYQPSLSTQQDNWHFLFSIDVGSADPELLLALEGVTVGGAAVFSNNGRWLSFYGADSGREEPVVYLYDVQKDALAEVPLSSDPLRIGVAPVLDWSDETDRLLVAGRGPLRIIPPEGGKEQTVVPPHPGCTFAGWAGS